MSKTAKHRACPFCGMPDPTLMLVPPSEIGFRLRYFVLCDYNLGGCGGAGGMYHSPGEAWAAWDERRRKYRDDR